MESLEKTPLLVADTRPALIWGMPHELAAVFLMGASLIMIAMENPLYLALVVPLWIAGREVARLDYNGVRLCMLWCQTKARSFDAHIWDGASPAPFPLRAPRRRVRGVF